MSGMHILTFGVFPLAAYVIGSTPFGVLIARGKGVDLRAQGSGNVGATNVGRVIGRPWGYVCFLLDVAKGLVPTLLVGLYLRRDGAVTTAEQLAWLLVAFGAIMGHVLSFYLRFRFLTFFANIGGWHHRFQFQFRFRFQLRFRFRSFVGCLRLSIRG